jgi:hypothetical protein
MARCGNIGFNAHFFVKNDRSSRIHIISLLLCSYRKTSKQNIAKK